MNRQLSWHEVYEMWKIGERYFPDTMSASISVESIFVDYKRDRGYIYGFDWLEETEATQRKQIIAEDPIQFLYFSTPSNKGTIHTAQMLAEAKDDEERAAIWIAATTFELMNLRIGNNVSKYASMLHYAAWDFLKDRFYLWHHAMRKLVPDVLIPYEVLESIHCESEQTVMGLIQMNVLMLRNSYRVLVYNSTDETKEDHSLRR